MEPLITMKNVSKVYETKAGPIHALRGVDLTVNEGEFVAIVGPSGSGKSTLINVITGIDTPTDGEIVVGGQRLNDMNQDDIATWRSKNVGVVFQFFQLLPTLTVHDNVIVPMQYANTHRGERGERALAMLRLVGAEHVADQYPAQISGGDRQRAAIARALVNDPVALVGDEPTGNLDPESAEKIIQLFEELVDAGKTIVLVTHDRALAGRLPRVEEVRGGSLVAEEDIDERLLVR
ncbi:MAG: ABC transporter ATP-binding protein [Chloroflexi bacterium]|nr:ABC transporter ATP-binding protein [Chloroflexota bacterium]